MGTGLTPNTREEMYYSAAVGETPTSSLPEPATRKEMYLDAIAKSGGGGGGFTPTDEQLAAMNSGITAEDVNQIGVNENNISSKPTRYIIDTGQSNTTTKSFDISTMPNGMYMLTHTNFTGATTKYGISVYMIYLLNGEVDCFTAMKEVNSAIITSITASDNTATITYGTTGYHETTALYLYKN